MNFSLLLKLFLGTAVMGLIAASTRSMGIINILFILVFVVLLLVSCLMSYLMFFSSTNEE